VSFSKYDLEDGNLINYALYKNREAFKSASLIYHSAPFDKDITVAGQIKLTISISMDVKDADLKFYFMKLIRWNYCVSYY